MALLWFYGHALNSWLFYESLCAWFVGRWNLWIIHTLKADQLHRQEWQIKGVVQIHTKQNIINTILILALLKQMMFIFLKAEKHSLTFSQSESPLDLFKLLSTSLIQKKKSNLRYLTNLQNYIVTQISLCIPLDLINKPHLWIWSKVFVAKMPTSYYSYFPDILQFCKRWYCCSLAA